MLDEFTKSNPTASRRRRRSLAPPTLMSTTRSTPPSRPASRRRSRSPIRTRPPSIAARAPSSTSSLPREQEVWPQSRRSEGLLPDLPRQRRQPPVQGRAARLPDPALNRGHVLQRRLAEAARLQRAAEGLEDLGGGRRQGQRRQQEQVWFRHPPRRLELRLPDLRARWPHPGPGRLGLRLQQPAGRRHRRHAPTTGQE